MRKISFLLFIAISITSSAQKQKSAGPDRLTGLDTAFARVLKDWRVAGFAVAIVQKNKVIYAKGFGYRDFENKIPVTPNTLFAIGSCTKAFTGSLLGMLRQDRKVDFDKPVRDYLPELKFYNNEMNDKITLRDMMCHRTGLPRHDFSWYYFSTPSRDSLLQRIQYMEPSAGLREKWQYNNFMFMAQGVVVEKLSGKSWEDNIREKIFQPLNMSHSVISIEEMVKSGDASIGYGLIRDTLIKKREYYHIDAMGPAGSINSCVNDMANWVITWINGGKFNAKEIIPSSYVNEAMSSQMIVGSALPDKEKSDRYFSNYGFGWFLSSYRGHYRVDHGGNIDGFSANTSFYPSDSIGIIVLTNQDGSAVPSIVQDLLADKMLGLPYFDWNTDSKNKTNKAKAAATEAEKLVVSSRKENTKPSHELKDYAGMYMNNGYGRFEVYLSQDSLFALVGTHTWWLRHYHYDWFEPIEKHRESGIDTTEKSDPMQFHTDKRGEIESVSLAFEPTVNPILFTRTANEEVVSKDSLQKYVGEYLITAITAKIYIQADQLFLFVPGQPEYKLRPTGRNKFDIEALKGYSLQFNTDENNQVTELLFIQPNGTFKATRKK